jgi:hypothetical protein
MADPFRNLLQQYRRVSTISARRVWPNGLTTSTKIAANLKIPVKTTEAHLASRNQLFTAQLQPAEACL